MKSEGHGKEREGGKERATSSSLTEITDTKFTIHYMHPITLYLVFPILEVEQQAAVLGLVSWCDVLMDCIQPVLNLIGNLLHLILRSVLQVTCIFTPVGRGRRWGKKEEAGGGKERGGGEKGKRKRGRERKRRREGEEKKEGGEEKGRGRGERKRR